MANVLQQYREQESLDETALADRLGITSEMYIRLAMCQRPTSDAARFPTQVWQIAAYVGCDPAKLAQIVRQVDALAAIEPTADAEAVDDSALTERTVGRGLLAAARDHIASDEDSAPPANQPDDSTDHDSE